MAQAETETVVMKDVAPEMAKHLSERLGRDLTIKEIEEEGLEALAFLRKEEKCPVCREGKVKQVPSVSCGIDIRCSTDDCQMAFTRREMGPKDPVFDKVIAFGFGHKVLSGREFLEEKRGQSEE